MKRILPLLIGLVLGLGGGTAYVMFMGGGEPEPDMLAEAVEEHADSTAAEDTTVAAEPEERPLGGAAAGLMRTEDLAELLPPEEEGEAVEAEAGEAEVPADPEATSAEVEAEPAALALTAADDDEDEPAKRLAKIFGTMQARDAARVLALLRHDEIERILRQLDDRSAAKILSSLDAELAAALSSTLIGARDR